MKLASAGSTIRAVRLVARPPRASRLLFVGMASPVLLLPVLLLFSPVLVRVAHAQEGRAVPIRDAFRDRDADGVPARMGDTVEVVGIVTSAPLVTGPRTSLVNLQDSTGGAILFARDTVRLMQLAPGDRVRVRGAVGQFRGAEQLIPYRIERLGTGEVPAPRDVLASDLLGERYGGQLVRVRGELVASESERGGLTAEVRDRSGAVPLHISGRYLSDPEFTQRLLRGGEAEIVGIAGQSDSEPPYDGGYQLIPRDAEDISLPPLIPIRRIAIAVLLALLAGALVLRHRSQRRAEEMERLATELRRSLSILEATMESTADGILVTDHEGRTQIYNQRFLQMWRIPEEMIRLTDEGALVQHVADQLQETEVFFAGMQARLMDDTGSYLDVLTLKDGRIVERCSQPQRIGEEVWGRVFSFRDVTEQRRAEEHQRELIREHTIREQAELAQERIRGVLESITDAFFALDESACFTYVNAEGVALLGRPREELLGHDLWELYPAWKERAFYSEYHRAVREQVAVELEEYFPGTDLWLRVRAYPYEEGMTVYVRDITARKLTEDALRLAKEEAEAASRAKTEMLSRTSHELRTPMNAILGFAQILQMDVQKDENRESVEHILHAGRHLLSLIDEVLDIARAESGQLTLPGEPVHVGKLAADALSLLDPLARKHQVELPRPPLATCDLRVLADPRRLKQVLINLLSNSIKYNHQAGRVEVICTEVEQERVRIEVRDTGPGMPPEKLSRLFVPFERAGAEQTQTDGTGLGLALSKALVQAMGGEIGAESTPGEGSTFWLELPCAAFEERATVGKGEATDASTVAEPEAPPRTVVLYVEDAPANVRLVERIFNRSRPEVELITTARGREGLKLATEQRPDLILLDLNLPDISGEEVLLALRDAEITREIPVVMISGDALPARIDQLREAGAVEYLTKPFAVPRFLEVVDEILRRAEV